MSIPGQLNPSQRLLLGPGPSDVHPRVLAAMTTPLVGHLDPEFLVIMNETQEMLREVYRTKNPLTFPVSATGTAGMETCLVNLLEPGEKAVICTAGEITLIQELPDGTQSVALRAGDYAINPRGVWHTADIAGHATALFITAGVGTEHRPR